MSTPDAPARQSFQIPVTTRGHCVVSPPGSAEALPLLVGFHGYAEDADVHMDALERIATPGPWLRCAVQGLHAFYVGRTRTVRASWMTRFNRELAIADNVRYAGEAVTAIKRRYATRDPLVYAGFSQGVAMAYRAAAGAGHACAALLVVGGDLPPDVGKTEMAGFPRVLIGRGADDEWYTDEKLEHDVATLEARGVAVQVCRYPGGHEWSDAYCAAASELLAALEV